MRRDGPCVRRRPPGRAAEERPGQRDALQGDVAQRAGRPLAPGTGLPAQVQRHLEQPLQQRVEAERDGIWEPTSTGHAAAAGTWRSARHSRSWCRIWSSPTTTLSRPAATENMCRAARCPRADAALGKGRQRQGRAARSVAGRRARRGGRCGAGSHADRGRPPPPRRRTPRASLGRCARRATRRCDRGSGRGVRQIEGRRRVGSRCSVGGWYCAWGRSRPGRRSDAEGSVRRGRPDPSAAALPPAEGGEEQAVQRCLASAMRVEVVEASNSRRRARATSSARNGRRKRRNRSAVMARRDPLARRRGRTGCRRPPPTGVGRLAERVFGVERGDQRRDDAPAIGPEPVGGLVELATHGIRALSRRRHGGSPGPSGPEVSPRPASDGREVGGPATGTRARRANRRWPPGVTKVRTLPVSLQRRTVEGETPSIRQASVRETQPGSFTLAGAVMPLQTSEIYQSCRGCVCYARIRTLGAGQAAYRLPQMAGPGQAGHADGGPESAAFRQGAGGPAGEVANPAAAPGSRPAGPRVGPRPARRGRARMSPRDAPGDHPPGRSSFPPCVRSQRIPSRGAHSQDGSPVAASASSSISLATSNASRRSRSSVTGEPARNRPSAYAARNRARARSIHASASRPGRSERAALPRSARRRPPRDVVQRAEHRGHVPQRGVRAPPVLDGPERLALEVDDVVAVVAHQHVAQVQVRVDPHDDRRAGQGLEARCAGGDGGRLASELPGGLLVHGRDGRDGPVQLAVGLQPPGLELVAGGESWREPRCVSGRFREGRMEAGHEEAEVLGNPRDVLEVHELRRSGHERGEALGQGLVQVVRVRDKRLEHRHGGSTAVAGDGLRPACQRWDAGEPGLLGQEGRELEIRVEARLDPPVALEEQPPAQHDRGVRLVAAEGALRRQGQVRGRPVQAAASPGAGRHTSAASTRTDGRCPVGRPGRGTRVARERRYRAALRDRHGQLPPRTVARGRLADAADTGSRTNGIA